MSLTLTITAQQCAEGALRHARRSLLGMVGMGLYFIKAQQIFRLPGGRPKTFPTVGNEEEASEGFVQWLAETFADAPFSVSRGSAYNYMRAASRMGLTPDSTEDDLEALEASGALAGKTARELYAPEAKKSTEPPAPPPDIKPEQVWSEFTSTVAGYFAPQCEAMRALPRLPVPALEGLLASIEAARDNVREILTKKKGARA